MDLVAAAIYAYCAALDNAQLDELKVEAAYEQDQVTD